MIPQPNKEKEKDPLLKLAYDSVTHGHGVVKTWCTKRKQSLK